MTDNTAWQPSAAYLYVLHLKGPGLAWEFLRRNPHYHTDWSRAVHGTGDVAHWGLSFPGRPDA